MIGNLITLFTAITAVFMRDRLSAGTVGLMITYAMQITQALFMLVRSTSEIEANIVSVERIHEYAQLTPEAPWEIPDRKPPVQWPTKGTIRYDHDRFSSSLARSHAAFSALPTYRLGTETSCSWYSRA